MSTQIISVIQALIYLQTSSFLYPTLLQQQLLALFQKFSTMNQHSDQCAICNQQPEDMLILSCSHNLCLQCATELYAASSQPNFLQCQICLANTPLDHETIQCLSSLVASTPLPPSPSPPQQEIKIPKPSKTKKGLECMEHREQALYFCFDCQNGTICSECILETAHAGHSIMTLKKASKFLAEKIAEHSQQLQDLKCRILQNCERTKESKESLIVETQERQGNLKALFQTIVKKVTDHYNYLSSQLESTSRRSIQIMDGTINSLIQRVEAIDSVINQSRQALQRPSDLGIVRRYAELPAVKGVLEEQFYDPISQPSQQPVLSSETTCLSQLEACLCRVQWIHSEHPQDYKQNQLGFMNSLQLDPSFLGRSPDQSKINNPLRGNHEEEQKHNYMDSMNRYSGIKRSSRRLELSRSMNNATNIISRLQERARR